MTKPSRVWSHTIAGMAVTAVLATCVLAVVPPAPGAAGKPAPPVRPPGVELRGRITGDGGQPLAHAVVRVLPDTRTAARGRAVRAESGDDGAFVVKGLTGAVFRVRVEAKGYAPLTEAQIPGGATLNLRLKRGFTLSGVVLDRGTRKPIDAATVLAWEKDAELWGEDAYRKSVGGRDGRFTIGDLPQGKVTVEARAAGHAAAKTGSIAGPAAPTADKGKPAPLELLLDPAGTLNGQVSDTGNTPVAGAEVTAFWRDASGAKSRTARTDAEGRYGIAAAAEVTVTRMTVRSKGFLSIDRAGPAPADGIVDFVLEHGGTIAGEVKTADGKAPTSFRVTARRDRGGPAADLTVTEPSGRFRIEDLEPGTYTVEVAADRYATIKKAEVEVRGEQVAEIGTLTLEPRSTLRGRVVSGRDEAPVPGAAVSVSLVEAKSSTIAPGRTDLWTASSSADGSFAIRGLASGTFDLTVEQPAYAPARMRITFDPEANTPEIVVAMFHGGTLTGTVIDARGDPVAGVRILASQGTEADARVADTGSDGRYLMDGLTPGTYQVTRQPKERAPSAGDMSKVASIREGETTTVDFDEAPRILLSGTVKRGGEPLQNAAIYLFVLDGRAPAVVKKAQTDDQGLYRVGLDQGGRYQASVRMPSSGGAFGQNVVMLTIPEQPEVHQDIVFAANGIVGTVTNSEGKEVKGAMILAVKDSAPRGETPRQSTTTTGADGTFRLDGVDAGTYRVSARATGYAPAEAYPVAVTDDRPEAEVDLTLERGWIMRGRVIDPDGQPVADAIVVVAAPGNAESGFLPSHTDRSGAFRITSPTDGPVNVGAISPRFAPAVQTDIQPPGGDDAPELELHATLGGTMRIRVVHRGGAPVAGVQAVYRPQTLYPGADVVLDRNRAAPTDADGTSVITHLYPGPYIVTLLGRRDAVPMQVTVGEGAETAVQFEVP